jgi:hypothetical protein
VKRIEVEIGELVLHGFPAGERYRIAESLAAELGRLIGERGAPEGITSREEVRTAKLNIRAGDAGVQIATAIFQGLGSEGSGNG